MVRVEWRLLGEKCRSLKNYYLLVAFGTGWQSTIYQANRPKEKGLCCICMKPRNFLGAAASQAPGGLWA